MPISLAPAFANLNHSIQSIGNNIQENENRKQRQSQFEEEMSYRKSQSALAEKHRQEEDLIREQDRRERGYKNDISFELDTEAARQHLADMKDPELRDQAKRFKESQIAENYGRGHSAEPTFVDGVSKEMDAWIESKQSTDKSLIASQTALAKAQSPEERAALQDSINFLTMKSQGLDSVGKQMFADAPGFFMKKNKSTSGLDPNFETVTHEVKDVDGNKTIVKGLAPVGSTFKKMQPSWMDVVANKTFPDTETNPDMSFARDVLKQKMSAGEVDTRGIPGSPDYQTPAPAKQSSVPEVNSKEDFEKLPKGAEFYSNGKKYTKP
jgi:hypothetical protein